MVCKDDVLDALDDRWQTTVQVASRVERTTPRPRSHEAQVWQALARLLRGLRHVEAGPMGAMSDVYERCLGGWVPYDDLVAGTMGREKERTRSLIAALYISRRMERRTGPDGRTEYRSVPGRDVADDTGGRLAHAILRELSAGPLSTPELAERTGRKRSSVRTATARLERKGLVTRAGLAEHSAIVWRLPRCRRWRRS